MVEYPPESVPLNESFAHSIPIHRLQTLDQILMFQSVQGPFKTSFVTVPPCIAIPTKTYLAQVCLVFRRPSAISHSCSGTSIGWCALVLCHLRQPVKSLSSASSDIKPNILRMLALESPTTSYNAYYRLSSMISPKTSETILDEATDSIPSVFQPRGIND